ncbi:MAG: hypothetical protein K0Q57_422 [Gammaproteobacteria bacterium]|jgi:hypothetical protein|nr:hypothetical protein [Gammaproteobacteria bacterium]
MSKTEKIECSKRAEDIARVMLKLPNDIYKEVVAQAHCNARSRHEEIIARVVISLRHNEEFMAKDRLLRLIYSKKLAYKAK